MEKQKYDSNIIIRSVSDIKFQNGYVNFNLKLSDGQDIAFKLSNPGSGVWRLQSSINGVFEDTGASQQLNIDLGEPIKSETSDIKITDLGKNYANFATKNGTTARLEAEPFRLSFNSADGSGIVIITDIKIQDNNIALVGSMKPEERLYGTGQRFNIVNQRGKAPEIWAIDEWCETEGNSYVPIPFFISTGGYGLLLNRFEHSYFDLGATCSGEWSVMALNAPVDAYFFINEDPARTLKSLADITGFAPVPPEWMFGIQVCRHANLREYATEEGVMEMVKRMDEADLPWDAAILEGWDTYTPGTYPELKRVTDKLHSMGKKVLMYQMGGKIYFPFVPEHNYKKEYMVKIKETGDTMLPETTSFNPFDNPDTRFAQYVDITSSAAKDWWFNGIWGTLVNEIGVDGAKIDFCEQFPDHVELDFYDGRTTKGTHHWYPVVYNSMMYKYYNENRPDGGMNFSRGGGLGVQRYPFIWAGDQQREWKSLAAILKCSLSSGLSGLPFMSHDLAGYVPADDPKNDIEERVFIRGAQFACFSPNMQTHGTVTRPYDFEPHIVDIYRNYCNLHNSLRPYLLEQSKISCETGIPLMRHLFLYDHNDVNVMDIEDEYMLGESFLVAPILNDVESRDIYLPKGKWQNIFTGETFDGQQHLKDYPVPFNSIAVFLNLNNVSPCADQLRGCLSLAY